MIFNLLPTADDVLIEGFVRTSRGTPIGGATIILSGSQQGLTTTDGNGHYSFTVPAGGAFQVSVSARGVRFSPTTRTFGSVMANQVADFNALPVKARIVSRPRGR